jgi:hypothetical protein
MRLMRLNDVSTSPHSVSVSTGFCAHRKSLQHELATILAAHTQTDSHRQVRVHLATVQVDVNLFDKLDNFLTAPSQDFGEHSHTQTLEPARNILESKASATQCQRIDLYHLPEDTNPQSASPFCLLPTAQPATLWKPYLRQRSLSYRANPAPEG